jgi:hypothetical protein
MPEAETYIGDGLYASFDGIQFKLRAPREHGDHVVYLEPDVMAELIRYARNHMTIGKKHDQRTTL